MTDKFDFDTLRDLMPAIKHIVSVKTKSKVQIYSEEFAKEIAPKLVHQAVEKELVRRLGKTKALEDNQMEETEHTWSNDDAFFGKYAEFLPMIRETVSSEFQEWRKGFETDFLSKMVEEVVESAMRKEREEEREKEVRKKEREEDIARKEEIAQLKTWKADFELRVLARFGELRQELPGMIEEMVENEVSRKKAEDEVEDKEEDEEDDGEDDEDSEEEYDDSEDLNRLREAFPKFCDEVIDIIREYKPEGIVSANPCPVRPARFEIILYDKVNVERGIHKLIIPRVQEVINRHVMRPNGREYPITYGYSV